MQDANSQVRPTRAAFERYLRSGIRIGAEASTGAVEFKFNPYHDPRNGQFTFAPGGPRSLQSVLVSDRRSVRHEQQGTRSLGRSSPLGSAKVGTVVDHLSSTPAMASMPGGSGPGGPGGNARAFYDPMTLQQVFPRSGTVGSAIIAPAESFLDLRGPANRLTTTLAGYQARAIIAQIREVDPKYHPQDWFPSTFQGQINYLNGLRIDRAAAFYRIKGDPRPLQVETLRFLRTRVDQAYAEGLELAKAGRLRPRLSEQEAIGNFVDMRVRRSLRRWYDQNRIVSNPAHPVRVVGREYQGTGTDRTYRIPDARVADVSFDVTLTLKTIATPQVKGFFRSDFNPQLVVIVRPSQLGPNSVYAIPRPGK